MRLMAFTLHLLGAPRRDVASLVDMKEESVKTLVRLVMRDGFSALRDRRRRAEAPPTSGPSLAPPRIKAHRTEDEYVVRFAPNGKPLRIPITSRIQARTVLLSLVHDELISAQEAAAVLGLHPAHCRALAHQLARHDVVEALVDKRQGQKGDYLVGAAEKAELILQLAARAIAGQSTSSSVLAGAIEEQTQTVVSPRTVRWHIQRLGLAGIKEALPERIEALKKNSR